MSIEMFKGNTSPSLTDTITYTDPVTGTEKPFDLSNVQSVKLQGRFANGTTLKINAVATIVNPTQGTVQYNWAVGDTDTSGTLFIWWQVTLSSGAIQDSPSTELIISDHGVTPFNVRDFVETGLADDALDQMTAGTTQEVTDRFGDDTERTERLRGGWTIDTLKLARPALSITSVIERDARLVQVGQALVVELDYDVLYNNRVLTRLTGGPWSSLYWRPWVDVTYVPVPEETRRRRLIIDLVKLEIQYTGLSEEKIGDYQSSMMDRTGGSTIYLKEREKLFQSFGAGRGFRFA